MNPPPNTHPFDLQAALAGARLVTRDGREVTEFRIDPTDDELCEVRFRGSDEWSPLWKTCGMQDRSGILHGIDLFLAAPSKPAQDEPWKPTIDGEEYQWRDFGSDSAWSPTCKLRNKGRDLHKNNEYRRPPAEKPAPDADGWISWAGGECPVERDVLVDIKYRDNCIQPRQKDLVSAYWLHDPSHKNCDIVAYRLSTPPQAKPAVGAAIPDGYIELSDAEKDGQWIAGAMFLSYDNKWKTRPLDGENGASASKSDRIIIPKPAAVETKAEPADPYSDQSHLLKEGDEYEYWCPREGVWRKSSGNFRQHYISLYKGEDYRFRPVEPVPTDPYASLKAAHAAGKVIQFWKSVDEQWRDLEIRPSWNLPVGNYRIKPWQLPAPPEGQQWHGSGWTEKLLEGGWRPLLLGETIIMGVGNDEMDVGGHVSDNRWSYQSSIDNRPIKSTDHHWRTKRPLPAPTQPEQKTDRYKELIDGPMFGIRIGPAVPAPVWHNPENVPADKVPEGWRFMVPEECDGRHKKVCQCQQERVWRKESSCGGSWDADNIYTTYIVPSTIPLPGSVSEKTYMLTPATDFTVTIPRDGKPCTVVNTGTEPVCVRSELTTLDIPAGKSYPEIQDKMLRQIALGLAIPAKFFTQSPQLMPLDNSGLFDNSPETEPNQTTNLTNEMNNTTDIPTPSCTLPTIGQMYSTRHNEIGPVIASGCNGVVLECGTRKEPRTRHYTVQQWGDALAVHVPSKKELRQQAKSQKQHPLYVVDAHGTNPVPSNKPVTTLAAIWKLFKVTQFITGLVMNVKWLAPVAVAAYYYVAAKVQGQ